MKTENCCCSLVKYKCKDDTYLVYKHNVQDTGLKCNSLSSPPPLLSVSQTVDQGEILSDYKRGLLSFMRGTEAPVVSDPFKL